MTTLATLRSYLNAELGIDDAEAKVYPVALRNRAISQGYASLWRAGVWKPVTVDVATVADQVFYTVSGMRALGTAYLLDSAGDPVEDVRTATLEQRGSSYILTVPGMVAGYTVRLVGWTAYVSTFANDAASDDLEEEYNRIPLIKAKAICFRKALGDHARYAAREALPPEMRTTADQLLALIGSAEREFVDESRQLARQRKRYGQPLRGRVL